MTNRNHRRPACAALALTLAAALALTGCAGADSAVSVSDILASESGSRSDGADTATENEKTASQSTAATATAATAATGGELFSDRDWDASYDGAQTIDCTGSDNVTITQEGVYLLTGDLTGSVLVEAGDTDKVQLVLQDLTVTSPDGPAIWVKNADKVFLTLPEGSTATLSDSTTYTMLTDDEPNAAVFVDCDLTIQGSGTLNVTGNYNHAIRCKDELVVTGGVLNLAAVGKGLKAKTTYAQGGGTITITKSEEGVEANDILICGGVLDVTASDDGLNASSPNNWTGAAPTLEISGGMVLVNAAGDGVDSNGTFTVSGGVLLVSGPTSSADGAIDYETSGTITGGVVIAAGAAGMAEGFGSASTQGSWMTNLTGTQTGGTSLTLVDADGTVLAHWTPAKDYANVVVSAPAMVQGGSYTLLAGATVAGTDAYGYAAEGTADGGEELATTTLESLTQNDGGGMMGGMGGGGKGGMGGMRGGMTDGTAPADGTTDGGTPPELLSGETPTDGGTPPELPSGEAPTTGERPQRTTDTTAAATPTTGTQS